MRYTDLINEADAPGNNDYQQMQSFLLRNKTPGVPPDQQLALALFRELQKTQQHNQELDSELAAAEKRIDVATQSGELSRQELGKHQGELERERGDIEKQQDKMSKIDQKNAEREKVSAEKLQNLTAQLEAIKQKPGASDQATAELEQQIQEIKANGVDKDKYEKVLQDVSRMQNMQQVDDKMLKGLVSQVQAAQAKADELSQTRATVGGEIEQTTAGIQDEIDQLKKQLDQFRTVERTVATLQPMVQDVIAPKVDKLVQKQQVADTLAARQTAQAFAAKEIAGGVSNMTTPASASQMSLPGIPTTKPMGRAQQMDLPLPDNDEDQPATTPPPTPDYTADRVSRDIAKKAKRTDPNAVYEDKLFRLIKWATGKNED